ncbi:MAG: beta-galactosidase [Candidatus Acidiferrales bacterium]
MKILKQAALASVCLSFVLAFAIRASVFQESAPSVVTFDVQQPIPPPETGYFHLGGVSKAGNSLSVNNRFISINSQPWLPVMGEFHFSRYPEKYWEEEILKMKAGGVQIVSTYIFWIHHEEIEGQFDWSGQRNLRRFIELCGKHGMYVFVRIGPWVHGEARNGGFPDWLLSKAKVRTNDPAYLSYVQRFYGEIGKQLQGLFWKDDGPIVGVQLENEYGKRGPDAGAAHISELKKIALESGIDAPLYTVTGWPNSDFPPREVIPVFGAYPDGFWQDYPGEAPPDEAYLFTLKRDTNDIPAALVQSAKQQDQAFSHDPYFLAEAGGGMELSYHRRPLVQPADVAAVNVTHVGSGANLFGYYMFHGGANPKGKLTTLQETHATGYPNDMPQISYDFQAPLGEFGQMHPSFRKLKLLHQFYNEFGTDLAPMVALLPQRTPSSPADSVVLRSAIRTNGDSGFLFINNYVHNLPMPERQDRVFQIRLPHETIQLPRKPVNIPANAYLIWPFNLSLGSGPVASQDQPRLVYSTAQLLTRLDARDSIYYVFFAIPGVAPQFAFDEKSLGTLSAAGATEIREGGILYLDGLQPSTSDAISIEPASGKTIHILLLSETQAENLWKITLHSEPYLILSHADVFSDDSTLYLRSRDNSALAFSVLPGLAAAPKADAPLQKSGSDGVFTSFAATVEPRTFEIHWTQTQQPGQVAPVQTSSLQRKHPVAVAPDDSAFKNAAVWKITLPTDGLAGLSDVFLRINYTGDIGRLYAGEHLLDDDFYHGEPWEVGLKRFIPVPGQELTLDVLPLRKDAPIYFSPRARPDFGSAQQISDLRAITAVPEYEVRVTF